MGDFTPQVALGGATLLLAVVIGAVFRLLRLLSRRDRTYERRIDELEADCAWCSQQRNLLINACERAGVEIPSIVWSMRPRDSKKGRADDVA